MDYNMHYLAPQFALCGYDNCTVWIVVDAGRHALFQHLRDVHGLRPSVIPPPSVVCKISSCTTAVRLNPGFSILQEHLINNHGYTPTDSHERFCQWQGCSVDGQAWRGQDLLRHVVEEHLGLVDHLCINCGRGPFANDWCLRRHQRKNCRGQTPARCNQCLSEFQSMHALVGHADLGLCQPPN
jgi:hypothetical protein